MPKHFKLVLNYIGETSQLPGENLEELVTWTTATDDEGCIDSEDYQVFSMLAHCFANPVIESNPLFVQLAKEIGIVLKG